MPARKAQILMGGMGVQPYREMGDVCKRNIFEKEGIAPTDPRQQGQGKLVTKSIMTGNLIEASAIDVGLSGHCSLHMALWSNVTRKLRSTE